MDSIDMVQGFVHVFPIHFGGVPPNRDIDFDIYLESGSKEFIFFPIL